MKHSGSGLIKKRVFSWVLMGFGADLDAGTGTGNGDENRNGVGKDGGIQREERDARGGLITGGWAAVRFVCCARGGYRDEG